METIKIYKAGIHLGEESILSGNHAAGMVNFSGCHLSCSFCYTPETSQQWQGTHYTQEAFLDLCRSLIQRGGRNLNLISPTQFMFLLHSPLVQFRSEYKALVPTILKTSGYESFPILRKMIDVTDIFVPDFKVWNPRLAASCGLPQRYAKIALGAIETLLVSHGNFQYDSKGHMTRGILIRHLMMPEQIADTLKIIDELARIKYAGLFNLMTYFYDPKEKRLINASPSDLALASKYASDRGMTVLINGKLHPTARIPQSTQRQAHG